MVRALPSAFPAGPLPQKTSFPRPMPPASLKSVPVGTYRLTRDGIQASPSPVPGSPIVLSEALNNLVHYSTHISGAIAQLAKDAAALVEENKKLEAQAALDIAEIVALRRELKELKTPPASPVIGLEDLEALLAGSDDDFINFQVAADIP